MIVVFGSINVDLLFGVDALPRAGETVLCPSYRAAAGGKGLNQAVAAARAAADPAASVRMVGRVGADGFAPLALAALEDAGVGTEAVTRSALPTGCAAVVVDRAGENQITVASGANTDLPPEALPEDWLGPETVLVLQMEVTLQSNWAVVARAKARGARVVLNLAPAKPVPADLLPSVDLLVLNEIEAGMLADAQGLGAGSGEAAARAIAERYRVTTVVSPRQRRRRRLRARCGLALRRARDRARGHGGCGRCLRRCPGAGPGGGGDAAGDAPPRKRGGRPCLPRRGRGAGDAAGRRDRGASRRPAAGAAARSMICDL